MDLLLIAPATANTISKIACGIDDTTVTTFATTAIGSKIPVIIVPAMHSSMYEHPIIQENIKKLEKKDLNVEILKPMKSEKKHKMPSIDDVVTYVIRKLYNNDLVNKRVLVIAGATAETVDDMRVLTNRSTGYTGLALSKLAFLRGGAVTLWLGKSSIQPPGYIPIEEFVTVNKLKDKVSKLKTSGPRAFQIIIVCAAISDYTSKNPKIGKISSGKDKLELELVPTPKILKIIRQKAPKSYLVGFKAEANLSEQQIVNKAKARLKEWNLNLIVAKDLSKVTTKTNQIIIIHRDNKIKRIKGEKEHLADKILNEIVASY